MNTGITTRAKIMLPYINAPNLQHASLVGAQKLLPFESAPIL